MNGHYNDFSVVRKETLELILKIIDISFEKYNLASVIALENGETTTCAVDELKKEITDAIKSLVR